MAARDRESFVNRSKSASSTKTATKPKTLSGEIKPADLREYEGELWARNLTGNVISHDDGRGNYLRIEPVHSGLNVVSLPREVATHPDFQRLWRRGKIEVSADPDMEESLYFADVRFEEIERERQRALGQGAVMEEPEHKKDLVQVECLRCGDRLFSTEAGLEERPPLCDVHRPLETSYIPEQKVEDGKTVTKWYSATLSSKNN